MTDYPLEVPFVVPDRLDPVEGWREWTFHSGHLWSPHRHVTVWPKNQPMTAVCEAHPWLIATPERFGMNIDEITAIWDHQTNTNCLGYGTPPTVHLAAGLGYQLRRFVPHTAPDPTCVCGIYAVASHTQVSDYSTPGYESCPVVGKVNLWGFVIPGEHGWRAQYAYPSALFVHPSMIDDMYLAKYGVPVLPWSQIGDDPKPSPEPPVPPDVTPGPLWGHRADFGIIRKITGG